MIEEVSGGDLFASGSEALVNPVNTEGVMGKGLALEFKTRFPEVFRVYRKDCILGLVRIGKVHAVRREGNPLWVLNFPTKDKWRDPSLLSYVEEGLSDLSRFLSEERVASVSLPALGCGLGGLPWSRVREAIFRALADSPTKVLLFPPR